LPSDVAKRLNTTINQILLEPEMKTRLQNDGAEVSALSMDEFAGFVHAEISKYQSIIAAADIKPE
jgi:tripartite-type tricarboxylate transporter receptor subunit TctC